MKTIKPLAIAILTLASSGLLLSQDKPQKPNAAPKDPFVVDPEANTTNDTNPRSLGILLEYIKLDHKTANKLVREWSPKATDAQGLRDELEKLIDADKAELLDTKWIQARSGNRAKAESVAEVIYPTEYDPAEIPTSVGGGGAVERVTGKEEKAVVRRVEGAPNPSGTAPDIHMTAPNPTAFETRNVGITFEVDPVLGADNKSIDLNMAPEFVTRLADQQMAREGFESTAKGVEHIWMPTFHIMRDTTQLTMIDGKYALLGIHNPPEDDESRIISMVRVDVIIVK